MGLELEDVFNGEGHLTDLLQMCITYSGAELQGCLLACLFQKVTYYTHGK